MREDLTFIAVVLDKSSSMNSVREATIEGFNSFIEEQKKAPGQALLLLTQFADEVVVGKAVPLQNVEPLNYASYSPYGNTALYDAIGKTIAAVGVKLAALPEAERPARVLVMIQTDGAENVSRYYRKHVIADMIQHQRDKYSWNFAFIGADESALLAAEALNIPANFTTQYAATPAGTAQVLRTASAGVANYRSVKSDDLLGTYVTMGFFPDEPVGSSQSPSK